MGNMTDEQRQKIIDKIQKLLALSKSPNENEAIAAAEKAQAMLAEYNLEISDLKVEDPIIRDHDFLTDYAAWIKPLLNSVAKLYFCGYYYESFPASYIKEQGFDKVSRRLLAGWHLRTFLRHNFIGTKANVIVAKNMGEYLISAMESNCKEGQKLVPAEERGAYRTSFMNACVFRLSNRLYERRQQSEEKGIQSNGTNLPALRDVYKQAQDAFNTWLENEEVKVRQKGSLATITHRGGAKDGSAAGDRIGLDQQVGNNTKLKLT